MISLLYHDVVSQDDPESSGFSGGDANVYKLDPPKFGRHLDLIEKSRRRGQVVVADSATRQPGASDLLFTFDDGGASAILIAQMLESHSWRGHFFITTDYIGKPGFLSAEQIRGLHKQGHVIGSHSCSHPARMSHCPAEQLAAEWTESVRVLSQLLKVKVLVASVPGGYYSRRVAEFAAAAGIDVLFTSEPESRIARVNGCMVLGRYSIQRGVSAETAAKIASGDWSPRASQYLLWTFKKIVKRVGGSYYIALRKCLLKNARVGTR